MDLAKVRDRAGQQEGRGTLGRGSSGLGLALWLPIPLWRKHPACSPWPVRSQKPPNRGWGWTKVSCPPRAWGCGELGLNMGRTENRTGRQKDQTPGDSPCYLDSKKPQYRHTGTKPGWDWPWRLRVGLGG